MYSVVVTHTGSLPIDVDDIKTYCDIDYTTDDTYLGELLNQKADWLEKCTGRTLAASTVVFRVSQLESLIMLFFNTYVADSLTVVDEDDEDVTSNCTIIGDIITLPDTNYYKLSYRTTADFPEGMKDSLLAIIANAYDNRGEIDHDFSRDRNYAKPYVLYPFI